MDTTPKILFKIHNLRSGYKKGNPVITLDNLEIYRNQITFIIGKSGSGKSTLLETLGFMNNTFVDGISNQVIYYDNNDQPTDIGELWSQSIIKHSDFRNAQFSFIFQENNLLEHFSALENILVPMMLNSADVSSATEIIKKAFRDIHLSESLLAKNIKYLSGGQRQRVSFLRALLATKPVLFGDEPTGNLDPVTARALMQMVRERVMEQHSSAIIVSHDLGLASQFADRIIVLKAIEGAPGILEDIYEKRQDEWYGQNGQSSLVYQEMTALL